MTLMNVDTFEQLRCDCDEQGHAKIHHPTTAPLPAGTAV
jgi:bis(5'-nucleosyl)-tetraphosphatase (symmetrical)